MQRSMKDSDLLLEKAGQERGKEGQRERNKEENEV